MHRSQGGSVAGGTRLALHCACASPLPASLQPGRNSKVKKGAATLSQVGEPFLPTDDYQPSFSLAIHKSTLATPRSPGSPEGRRARERPPCPFGALNGRPERILPWHLGPTRAPRGGRRHAASIWAWRGTPAEHGAAGRRRPPEHRCSCWRSRRGCRDAARPAAGAPPCRDADACCTTEKSRHILSNPARPKARREARGPPSARLQPLFAKRLLKLLTPLFETPFETSDFSEE